MQTHESYPIKDEFEFDRFAAALAKGINKHKSGQSLIISLEGPWGSGKTTTIQFLKQHIKKLGSINIIDKNVWHISSHEKLAQEIFSQILEYLELEDKHSYTISKSLTGFSHLLFDENSIGVFSSNIYRSGTSSRQQKNLIDLEAAESALKDALMSTKVSIILDDIDRLSPVELMDFFRVIKAISTLPNLLIILILDRKNVVKTINKTTPFDGNEYLEKIIHAQFTLPKIKQTNLDKFFIDRLNKIIENTNWEYNEGRLSDLYQFGIKYLLLTPRNIINYTNSLEITLAAVENEVDFADFLCIEALRLFRPDLYNTVRDNKRYFVNDPFSHVISEEDFTAFHEVWKRDVGENNAKWLVQLMTHLFPDLKESGRNGFRSANRNHEQYKNEMRICSSEYFESYFSFASSSAGISKTAFAHISTGKLQTLIDFLHPLLHSANVDDHNLLWSVVERLIASIESENFHFDPESLYSYLISAFADYSQHPEAQRLSAFRPDNILVLTKLLFLLLSKLKLKEITSVVLNSLSRPFAIEPMLWIVAELGAEHGFFQWRSLIYEKLFIERDDYIKVLNLAKTVFQDLLIKSPLPSGKIIARIILFFNELNIKLNSTRLQHLLTDQEGLVGLITLGQSEIISVTHKQDRFEYNFLEIAPYIELERLAGAINKILETASTQNKEKFEAFLKQYDRYSKRNKNEGN